MRQLGGGGFKGNDSNKKKLVLLVGALGFVGLVTIVLSLSVSSQTPAAAVVVQKSPDDDLVNVLIAVRQIETGEKLEPSFFRVERRLKSSVTPGTMDGYEQIREMYARSTIGKDGPVHQDFVTSVKPTNLITANIPEGYRAVTIRVDATSSVEGWARAGANVDVVWASTIRGRQGVTVIVQNARVLSAERQVEAGTQPGTPVPSTVTLLVTADDAAKIQLATTTGSLSLSLRGDDDAGKGSSGRSITVDDLLGGAQQVTEPTERRDGTVRIGGEEFFLEGGQLIPKGE